MVGSGIVGASCAYAASSLGAEVVLVEAAKPGRATAAGAGIICPWSAQVADPAWCALAYAAAREYPALTARLADLGETGVGYRKVGALALAEREEDREQIRQALLARRAAAPEIGEVAGVSGAERATRETGSGFDYRITPAGLAEILEQTLAVAPGLADGTYLETRVGFRPMGPDIRPLLGPVPGLDGLVIATGLGASGLTMGPLAGSLAAQVALGLPPAIDLEPFAPLRGPSGSR